MTQVICPQEYRVIDLSPDGKMATVITGIKACQARGVGDLPSELIENLKNDPTMTDSGFITFGGYGFYKTQIPTEELLTRKEKKELKAARRLHQKGYYIDLMMKYGSKNLSYIEKRIFFRTLHTTRYTIANKDSLVNRNFGIRVEAISA